MSESKIVVVFRSKLRPGVEAEIAPLGMSLYQQASALPGFISYKDFSSEDGEGVAIVEFETMDSLEAWRHHPDHMMAKERGKSEFFESYHIQICNVVQAYGSSRGQVKRQAA